MNIIRKIINTRLNGIRYKERCSTPYKHFMIIQKKPNGDYEKRCCWCAKTISDVAEESNIRELDLRSFYQIQLEWV